MTTAAHPKPPAAGRQTRPTWAELIAREPRLVQLEARVRRVRATTPDYCAAYWWYGPEPRTGFKEQLCRLVGWDRKDDPLLGSCDSYDTAYEHLYDLLPDCRHKHLFCRW